MLNYQELIIQSHSTVVVLVVRKKQIGEIEDMNLYHHDVHSQTFPLS